MKHLLKIASVYQIVIWLISIVSYVLVIVNSIWPNKDYNALLICIAVICFSVMIVYSNVYLLLNKGNTSFILKNLYFNKWINIIQIVNISLFGFTFYAIVGVRIMGYYIYDDTQKFALDYGFFKFKSEVSYIKSDIIFVGMNFIPIMLSVIFNRYIGLHKKIPLN
jgi:hypothetical protein